MCIVGKTLACSDSSPLSQFIIRRTRLKTLLLIFIHFFESPLLLARILPTIFIYLANHQNAVGDVVEWVAAPGDENQTNDHAFKSLVGCVVVLSENALVDDFYDDGFEQAVNLLKVITSNQSVMLKLGNSDAGLDISLSSANA